MVMEYATVEDMLEGYKKVRERLFSPKLIARKETRPTKVIELKDRETQKTDETFLPVKIEGFIPHRGLKIVKDVLSSYNITKEIVFSKTRKKNIISIRHEIWFKLRQANYSYPAIAALTCGGKAADHTTVMNGVRSHQKRMQKASEEQC